MIRTHIYSWVLFVLMCGTSEAAFTATLPPGNNMGATLVPCVKYSQMLCTDPNYNPLDGLFTVPVGMDGTYLVSATMMTGLVSGHAQIRRNKSIYVWLFTGNKYDMATQTVSIDLVAGNNLSVVVTTASSLFDRYNTFTVVKVT